MLPVSEWCCPQGNLLSIARPVPRHQFLGKYTTIRVATQVHPQTWVCADQGRWIKGAPLPTCFTYVRRINRRIGLPSRLKPGQTQPATLTTTAC